MKSLFASKTFWFNIASVLASGVVPGKFAVPIAAAGNIVLRVLTDTPVTVLPR